MRTKMQKMITKISKNSQGFTLVELMIVVAIIGILASIAIPNYQKFQAKARQSEAKLKLAGLYTSQKSYQVESTTYSTCLPGIGFSVEGKQSFYTVGVGSGLSTCGMDGASACDNIYSGGEPITDCTMDAAISANFPGSDQHHYRATMGAGGPPTTSAAVNSATLTMTSTDFVAGAMGQIGAKNVGLSDTSLIDQWTIDQDKSMKNLNPGKAF